MYKHRLQSKASEPSVEAPQEYSTYQGRVHSASLHVSPKNFPGEEWLKEKIKNKERCGLFLGWKEDRTKDDNHSLAIMAIADPSQCILFRIHVSGRYLPETLVTYLESALCEKFVDGWRAQGCRKFADSFDGPTGGVAQCLNVTDVCQMALEKGIDKVGLASVAEAVGFSLRPKPKVDWLADTLSTEAELYAAESAYFSLAVSEKLEKMETVQGFENDACTQFDSCLSMEEGWAKQGIERRSDGLWCNLCGAGPMVDRMVMKQHVESEKHMRRAGMWPEPDQPPEPPKTRSLSSKQSKIEKWAEQNGWKVSTARVEESPPTTLDIDEPEEPVPPSCCEHGCARNCVHGCHGAVAVAPRKAAALVCSAAGSNAAALPSSGPPSDVLQRLLDMPLPAPLHKRSEYHTFAGNLIVVNLAQVPRHREEFPGSSWFAEQLRMGNPLGWDIEWRPDKKGCSNPVALMQFSSKDTAVLLRTHITLSWLPEVVTEVLKSDRVAKIGVGYDGGDRKKMQNTFDLEPANLIDLADVAQDLGLKQKGLKTLAEVCGLRLIKDQKTARSDWATSRELTEQQTQYAADDAYFSLVIYEQLMKIKDPSQLEVQGRSQPEDQLNYDMQPPPAPPVQASLHFKVAKLPPAPPLPQPPEAHIKLDMLSPTPYPEQCLMKPGEPLIVRSAILEVIQAIRAPPEGFYPDNFLMLEKQNRLRCVIEPDKDGWLWGSALDVDRQGWVNMKFLAIPEELDRVDPGSWRPAYDAGESNWPAYDDDDNEDDDNSYVYQARTKQRSWMGLTMRQWQN